jgi:hypothetical protein
LAGVGVTLCITGRWDRSQPTPVQEPGPNEARRGAALVAIPSSQRSALADHAVSRHEYEVAVGRAIGCLRSAVERVTPPVTGSIEIVGPRWTADGFSLRWDYSVPASVAFDPRPLDRACQARHLARVETVFHEGLLADRTYRQGVAGDFHRCLDRSGAPGSAASGPRARFEAIVGDLTLAPEQRSATMICIGDRPSIGDLNP